MSDLVLGLVVGYVAGTAGMLLTFLLARTAAGPEEERQRART